MSDLRPHDWNEPVVVPESDPPRTVLVPFDGSHTAERALAWSVLVAHNNDAEVIVVVAFDPPLTVRGRGASYVEEMKATLEGEAHELAEQAVRSLLDRTVNARGKVVRGDVARAILEVADEESVDLIILGRQGVTHEVGGATLDRFRALMSGGIAEKVSRHAEVPVLVVV
ncbi:MAG: universal stress protein [Actinomycetota bacterium]